MAMPRPPVSDMLSSIPGALGIRLEAEPRHDVIDRIGDVEIRRYAPALLAQVSVDGAHEQALDRAFEKLAGYIYGENVAAEKMHMTTPVFHRESADPTVPVLERGRGGGWTVAFFLGNDMAPADVPAPNDPSIELVEAPATVVAALRYSGHNDARARERARAELLAALDGASRWSVADDVLWAQYDQPFAVPFLKRNEAQVAVRERS